MLAALRLPVGLLPEVGIPRLSVQVSYPDAAARTLESTVVSPLRNTLLQVNGLSDLRSRSRDEAAVLYLDFPFGTDPDLAFIEVNEKIDQAMNQLPRDLPRPRVLATNVSDIPVVQLSVTLRDSQATDAGLLELSELGRLVLRRRLEQLPQIAFADMSGQRFPQITVRPDRPDLRAVGLDESDLTTLIEQANLELGGLLLRDGPYEYGLRFTGELRDANDLENLYLRTGERTLPLRDLASVTYEAAPVRGAYFHNGRPGIAFTLRKRADARLFALQENLDALLDDLRTEYPELSFDLNNDQTAVLRASVSNLTQGLAYGAGFAVLVLLLFFRGWRRPLLVAVAVPVALSLAVLGFYLAGLTVNVISLAGLILGLGLMIDNSIIVLDSIDQAGTRQSRPGRGPARLTSESTAVATNEVIRPLISSALTTVAVFLPLVLLSGIAGALFLDQAVAVTLALAASLLVAYFLLPLLVWRLVRPGRERGGGERRERRWRRFERTVDAVLDRLWISGVGVMVWLGLGFGLLGLLPTTGFPELSRPDYRLVIDWNEPLGFEEHGTRVRALTREWRERYGGQSAAYVGERQFLLDEEGQATNAAELQFYLDEAPDRTGFARDLLNRWRERYPRAALAFRPLPNLFDRIFLNDAPYLELRLRDPQGAETPAPGAVSVLIDSLIARGYAPEPPGRAERLALRVDYERLRTYDIDPARVTERLLGLFGENEVTRLRANDRALPVLLATAPRAGLTDERLRGATVASRDGEEIPLRYLLHLDRERDYRALTADRAGEYLSLALADERGDAEELRELVGRVTPDLSLQLAGRYFTDQSRVGELGGVLLVSLLLLYLILAAQFEGLRLPLVVLLVVPVSLVGTLVALWLAGESLNLLSLIGMVVTGGIVVNDAIIKLDMIERARREGLGRRAAIHRAGRRRLRAIVMTSLTTILALAPVLFASGLGAELQRPLAVAVLGGLSIGTVGSLYVVPLFYIYLTREWEREQVA